jgi:hypothetical protein
MRGLDPRIHQKKISFVKVMDCRVKPGNDGGDIRSLCTGLHRKRR